MPGFANETTQSAGSQVSRFAVAPSGAFGYWSGTRSLETAKSHAISNCRTNAPDCAIYAIDNSLAGAEARNGK